MDAVIAGSVEEADTMDLGSVHTLRGQTTQNLGLLTSAIQHKCSDSLSHKHLHTAFTHVQ